MTPREEVAKGSDMNEDIAPAAPKGMFTKDMIDALRSAYEKINTVNPSSPQYKRLSELLDSLDKDQLKQLVNANIKFISKLASVRINRMKESVTESLAFRLPNEARARKSAEILRRDEVGEVTIKGDMITIEVPCSAGQVGGSSVLHSRILEHMRTMGGRFLKGTDGPVSERIFQTIKEETHVPTPKKLNTSVLRNLNDVASRILFGEIGSIKDNLSEAIKESRDESVEEGIELEEDSHHKPGDIVQVPHKGKMVKGKIVRFDSGGTNKAKQHGGGFIVDVGEPASILVPTHEVQKEEVQFANLTKEVIAKGTYLGYDKKFGRRWWDHKGYLYGMHPDAKHVFNNGSVNVPMNQRIIRGLIKDDQ